MKLPKFSLVFFSLFFFLRLVMTFHASLLMQHLGKRLCPEYWFQQFLVRSEQRIKRRDGLSAASKILLEIL